MPVLLVLIRKSAALFVGATVWTIIPAPEATKLRVAGDNAANFE
jgi:hypothetical protein